MYDRKTNIDTHTRFARARRAADAFHKDFVRATDAAARGGGRFPKLRAAADASTWALATMRAGTALRAVIGTSLGLNQVLRIVFHVDAWSDDIGGGLRLPHPFGIVIGEGAVIDENCTLMHNVTIQRGAHTHIGKGTVIGTGAVVLAGAQVGDGALIGAQSVVRGDVPAATVAVGAPARVIRAVRPQEAA